MDFAERFADFVQKLGLAWQRVSLAEFFVVVFFFYRGSVLYITLCILIHRKSVEES